MGAAYCGSQTTDLHAHAEGCDFLRPPKEVIACTERCRKEDQREIRDLHEFTAVAAGETELGPAQWSKAQRVVDRTLRALLLGRPVQTASGGTGRLYLSTDFRTLELEQAATAGAGMSRRRVPLSEIVDASFGSGGKSLVVRFSGAMPGPPLELWFDSEEERLCVALTLKVLRARQAPAQRFG